MQHGLPRTAAGVRDGQLRGGEEDRGPSQRAINARAPRRRSTERQAQGRRATASVCTKTGVEVKSGDKVKSTSDGRRRQQKAGTPSKSSGETGMQHQVRRRREPGRAVSARQRENQVEEEQRRCKGRAWGRQRRRQGGQRRLAEVQPAGHVAFDGCDRVWQYRSAEASTSAVQIGSREQITTGERRSPVLSSIVHRQTHRTPGDSGPAVPELYGLYVTRISFPSHSI
jgi:hypothetical protein